jgi:hypothetical protein
VDDWPYFLVVGRLRLKLAHVAMSGTLATAALLVARLT